MKSPNSIEYRHGKHKPFEALTGNRPVCPTCGETVTPEFFKYRKGLINIASFLRAFYKLKSLIIESRRITLRPNRTQ